MELLGTDKPMDSRNPNLVRLLEEKNPQLGDKPILENRHSGILTMRREMEQYGLPEPEFINGRDEFTVIFRNGTNKPQNTQVEPSKTTQVTTQVAKKNQMILKYCKTPRSVAEISNYLGLSSSGYTRKKYIIPLIKSGQLKRTNESSPTAPNQKYYS